MDSLYLLIPLALIITLVAVKAFFWAVKSGQYEDLDTEARRILFDEKPVSGTACSDKLNPSSAIGQNNKKNETR